ncbi:hypothetical protein CC80DRAFT_487424 [Byssothecium circinans]|uniref:Fibroin-3 related protein n=1 Tax=Byssothecium circinans TaxID=147558 RepID=A0A6A5UFA3_9PLEO|nr:hypothetical protein CC80DRAFT_487424 [Byssothecium circinans]
MPSLLVGRDPFTDVRETLSSWDKCMAKTYCKWPVIVAIIVGGIIVLSVVFCIARCVCCGAELACCCFKCCTCCCPSGGRGNKHKRMKSDPAPYPPAAPYHASAYSSAPPAIPPPPIDSRPLNQQYRSHDAPAFRPSPFFNPAPTPTAAKKEQPQFARFDAHGKPENEDALPAMPSWNDAKDVHVQEEVMPEKPTDMEMDRLDHNGSVTGNPMTGAAAIAGAGPRRSPGPGRSPMRTGAQDGYGFPPAYQNDSFVSGVSQSRPYGQNNGYGTPQRQISYGDVSPVQQSVSPVHVGAGAGYAQNGYGQQNQQYDRRSPGPGYGQQEQQQYRRPSQPNSYGHSAPQQPQEPAPMYQQDNYSAGPPRSLTPGYAPSGSTQYTAYPGQQTYESSEASYPGQQPYQAFTPGQPQGQQTSGVTRRPVEGSWKEV